MILPPPLPLLLPGGGEDGGGGGRGGGAVAAALCRAGGGGGRYTGGAAGVGVASTVPKNRGRMQLSSTTTWQTTAPAFHFCRRPHPMGKLQEDDIKRDAVQYTTWPNLALGTSPSSLVF